MGVLLSRVFENITEKGKRGTSYKKLTAAQILWLPLSAIITLLIYTSFTEQISLNADILSNLALSFGFGFGFDKIFTLSKHIK